MIAKGNLHAHGAKLAAYLTTGKDGERAELVSLRGFAADNIRDAFIDVQIQSEATRATKPFFHAYVRLPEGEGHLALDQWQRIADRIDKELGFEGQGRAVAFHHQADGETHMHIAWSRIDLDTMKAIDPGLYKNKLKEICRELEAELDLTRVSSARAADDQTQTATRDEFEQSRRLDTDLKAIRNTIHDCWQSADNGRAFAAALNERGLILARGDVRDFVVIDHAGGDHALSKRITQATAAETRALMADLDRSALPSVTEAKEMQRAKTTRAQALDELTEIHTDLTASKQEPRPMTEPYSDDLADEQVKREAAYLDEMERQETARRAFLADKEKQAVDARAVEEERRKTEHSEDATRVSNGEITSADVRYAQSLGDNYDPSSPYRSLARASMDEYGKFMGQQAELTREAAKEVDPEQRRLIDLRKEIEGNEYLALGSARLATISEIVTGKLYRPGDYEKAVQDAKERGEEPRELTQPERDMQNAQHYSNNAKVLREERAKLQEAIAERDRQKAEAQEKQAATPSPTQQRDHARPTKVESEQPSKAKQDDDRRQEVQRAAHNETMQGIGKKPEPGMSADATASHEATVKFLSEIRQKEARAEELREIQRQRQVERGRGRGGRGR